MEMTGAEQVLYKVQYKFACDVLELSEPEAREMAMQKIIKTRTLGKQLKRTEYGRQNGKGNGCNGMDGVNGCGDSSMYVARMD